MASSSLTGKRTRPPTPDPQDNNVVVKRVKPLVPSQSFADILKEMPINVSVVDGPSNTITVDEDLVLQYVDIQCHPEDPTSVLVFGVTEEGMRVLVHVNNLLTLPPRPDYEPLYNFMFHYEIAPMSWIEIPALNFEAIDACDMISYNQIEVFVDHEDMIFHPPQGNWDKSAPLRILSFDVSTVVPPPPGNQLPCYERDPVLQIGNMLTIKGESDPYLRCIFTLGACSDISGAEVKSYETEDALLLAWREFIIDADPDLIVGYNIGCFDIPQLLLRARFLQLHEFPYLGRLKDVPTKTVAQPVNHRKLKDAPILTGRLQLDTRQYMLESTMRRENFTVGRKSKCDLNTIAREFVGKTKEGIAFTVIEDLQFGGPDGRRKLAVHCLKETHLPLEIFSRLRCLDESLDAARSSEEFIYRPFREFLRNGRNPS
ncbi:ribonuclease H-like domain-containing protein [Mycena belliarum]|uniref:DNA polymerase delta catalytic subunit n=1 Tax=Mycena belliarum TaxID=1033014 RepID=A0AAD6TW78_9AGAR|nr:ribonuclease H-like domain-containing protein [Mycena belliae]